VKFLKKKNHTCNELPKMAMFAKKTMFGPLGIKSSGMAS